MRVVVRMGWFSWQSLEFVPWVYWAKILKLWFVGYWQTAFGHAHESILFGDGQESVLISELSYLPQVDT